MTKIEQVIRDLSELYNFNLKIQEIKKANAHLLGQCAPDVMEPHNAQTEASPKPCDAPATRK